jgi:NitT/TauT family transport system permease protein
VAAAFWIAVWSIAAEVVGRDFLLASPGQVVVRLIDLVVTADFWATVGTTLMRIALGFVAAAVVGMATAALSARFRTVDVLTSPLISTIRSVPVVSFIILVLLWADASTLAAVTSFLMVVPIMHTSILEGIRSRDARLLEVVEVFEIPTWRRIRAVDIPAVLPFFAAASRIGIGLAWKAGVAAEVIGVSQGSIGERLYQAKIFLESADLFAWTVVIVALSIACEALALRLIRVAQDRNSGGVA